MLGWLAGVFGTEGLDDGPPGGDADVEAFQESLRAQLGDSAPQLLRVSLTDALARARDAHTALVVLLTSELHEDAKAFVHDVLGDAGVGDALCGGPFTVWGASVLSREGQRAAGAADATQLPFMGLFMATSPTSSKHECVKRLYGVRTAAAARAWLREAEAFAAPRMAERRADMLSRATDRMLRDEQEQRYREVQERDRRLLAEAEAKEAEARALQRRREEEEARRLEEAALAEETAALAQVVALSSEERIEEEGAAALRRLRPEPPEGAPGVATVRMTLPGGMLLERRFAASEPLASVRAYAAFALWRLGFSGFDGFRVGSRAPPMTLEPEDDARTLAEAGLAPRARLFVVTRQAEAEAVAAAAVRAARPEAGPPTPAPAASDGVPFQRRPVARDE